jgi:hypothetical protein
MIPHLLVVVCQELRHHGLVADEEVLQGATSVSCAHFDSRCGRQCQHMTQPTLKVVKASDAISKLATSTLSKKPMNLGSLITILHQWAMVMVGELWAMIAGLHPLAGAALKT